MYYSTHSRNTITKPESCCPHQSKPHWQDVFAIPNTAEVKKAGEELFFDYGKETGAPVYVYRFVNLMGHSRPKYNSAISTFCWAVANDEQFTVNDRSTELEVLYIDDLVEGMFDLLEGKEQHCEFMVWRQYSKRMENTAVFRLRIR